MDEIKVVLGDLKVPPLAKRVTHWEVIPPQSPDLVDFPKELSPLLLEALKKRGIRGLYTHQGEAYQRVKAGEDIVVVTPTSSGKTLCYNLPVIDAMLNDNHYRAIYFFPTKALSHDQREELKSFLSDKISIKSYTYDGDTPARARKKIRTAGQIVITNPDMLHTGILPHHTKWMNLFENLRFVVIDELHYYRGILGSHVANVLRRLKRICDFYGSKPIFITSSATVANPLQHARLLLGRQDIHLITKNGAPRGEKHFIFYNPPVVDWELGIRRSSLLEARTLAQIFLKKNIQTIVFTRSRLRTEVLSSYLKEALERLEKKGIIKGYRGGYLPKERRAIEEGLRKGEIRGVVSTNALELGIDIGQLKSAIICGYPGSIASTWQQAGRAGRGEEVSAAILIASNSPLDQFIIQNPQYFFGKSPEYALINPENLVILVSHLKCAAFELPFEEGEIFGEKAQDEILNFLVQEKILRLVRGRYYWMTQDYPAHNVSLRCASPDNFVIIDETKGSQVIGEVDRFSAHTLIHQDAIYLHQSQQYHITSLDYEKQKAYARRVQVNYYTDASLAVDIKVLDSFEEKEELSTIKEWGEVMVFSRATMFKKIKFHSHENVGYGEIDLPEEQMHTTSYWFSITGEVQLIPDALQSALLGLSNLLVNLAPLQLMCDPRDIRVVTQIRSPFTKRPTIFLYDHYPGGASFSERLYLLHQDLLQMAHQLVSNCSCGSGCPSCVGPLEEVGLKGKEHALLLLTRILPQRD